jgi:photosystem II stability/assembly factor-like uncharacterized protein
MRKNFVHGVTVLWFVALVVGSAAGVSFATGSHVTARHATVVNNAAASAASPTWTEKSLPWGSIADPAMSISCPDLSHCWVTDFRGGIYTTNDGGAIWNGQYQINTGYDVQYIDCATDTSCVAIESQEILWTDDGGSIWNTSPLQALSLSCPSATTCFATSGQGAIDESTDGGATWTQLDSTLTAQLLTCPSTTTCYGTGYNGFVRTTDGGATWETMAPLPAVDLEIGSITCPTITTCLAVGPYSDDIFRTTNAAQTWTQITAPPVTNVGFGAMAGVISCPSATTCYITDSGNTTPQTGILIESTDAGATWSDIPLPANQASAAVSCPTVEVCYMVGGSEMVTDVGPVSAPTATLTDPTVAATDDLTTTFTTTAIGALGPGATITLYAPSSASPQYTIFPLDPSAYSITDGTEGTDEVGSVQYDQEGSSQVTLVLSVSAITDDDTVAVAVTGMTNSAYASATWSVDISTSADLVPSPTAPIVLSPGPLVPADSSVEARPQDVARPDGSDPVNVEVALSDSYGNALVGKTVTLTQGSTSAVVAPPSLVTAQSGEVEFSVTDTTAEVVDLTAIDVTDGVVVGDVLVEFAVATPTVISLSSSDPNTPLGQPLRYTAVVFPPPNGGTVSFSEFGGIIPGCGDVAVDADGQATCTVALLPEENFDPVTIGADYSDIPPVADQAYYSSFTSIDQYFSYDSPVGPTVTEQPTDEMAEAGQEVIFTAAASGDPTPLVQWQVSTDGGVDWASVPGATSPSFTLVVTSADTGNQYEAVFTGAGLQVVSSPATLTVADGLAVTTTVLPAATGGVAFSAQLQAVGGGKHVRWRKTKGLLPKGMSLKSNGTLSGTPTVRDSTEVYSFTVSVHSQSHGKKTRAVQSLTLTVLPSS